MQPPLMTAYSQEEFFGFTDGPVPAAPSSPAARPDENITREKLRIIHQRLCREYGCPVGYFHELTPLDELVSSLLSHRTRNSESGAAYKELRRRFVDWTAVRDAPTSEVEDAIRTCNWPEQKAPRIQHTLRLITQLRDGDLSLDFLESMPVREGRDWLEQLPGVGPKTSAAVYIFSRIRGRALPVDSHHHRVAQRLGLISMNLDVGPAHAVLEAMLPDEWDAQTVYDDHEILMFHGQRCCHYRGPECGRCVLLDLCPSGQERLESRASDTTSNRQKISTTSTLSVAASKS